MSNDSNRQMRKMRTQNARQPSTKTTHSKPPKTPPMPKLFNRARTHRIINQYQYWRVVEYNMISSQPGRSQHYLNGFMYCPHGRHPVAESEALSGRYAKRCPLHGCALRLKPREGKARREWQEQHSI